MLADLIVQHREQPVGTPGGSSLGDDAQVGALMTQVLSITAAAARHAAKHSPLSDVDRPVAIARYAEHALDRLDVTTPTNLSAVASFAPPPLPTIPNEHVEAVLRAWAPADRTD